MQELKITTPHKDGSYHIVYVNSETGQGAMSGGKDGHTHQLTYDPPRDPVEAREPQIDPMTGQPAINPETGQPDQGQEADPGKEVGSWVVMPNQPEGEGQVQTSAPQEFHEHELLDYPKKKAKKLSAEQKGVKEAELLKECMSLWKEALKITEDCRKLGKESEDFYQGKQWADEIKRGLNANDLAALTINEIGPNIDTLLGYQMEQRTDIKYLPQEGGDQRVADMINIVTKKILDATSFAREETKVFKDICVAGFGSFNIFVDFNNTIQGDIKIERFPWSDIVYGPHEKEDLSDCEYEVRSRMFSIAKIKQMYKGKAEKVEASYSAHSGQLPDVDLHSSGSMDGGTNTDYRAAHKVDDQRYTVDGSLALVDVQKKQFRMAQVARKIYKEVSVIFNQAENYFFTAHDWEDEDVVAAAELPGFQVITQTKTRMRMTKFIGGVILSDENPADLPVNDFFTVPVYGYRQNGEYWGKVESAKDPQREINKRRSQAMDSQNKLGADIYYVEDDMFPKNNKEHFKKNRSKPGAVIAVNDITRTPVREAGAPLPVALVQMMQLDQDNLQRLMNVVVEKGGANESGALFLERKKGRLTGNQFLFDNLSFAKQRLGKLLVGLIQRYYTPERMERLLNSQYNKQKFEIGGDDYDQYTPAEIIEMLEDANLLAYDVIVSESSFAPSTRMGIAMSLFDLMSQGADIPPDLPLEFIDMPADLRMRISDRLQQQQEMAAQTAGDTSNTEIKKTAIASGGYTINEQEAEQLGLVPTSENLALPNEGQIADNEGIQEAEYADNLAGSLAG